MAGGRSAFQNNCMQCHGSGGAGTVGYPALVDDDWIWGGSLAQIYKTIEHGIRNSDPDSRTSMMPKFGVDNLLTPAQISGLTLATATAEDKARTRASWGTAEVAASAFVMAAILGAYLYFRG